MKRETLAEPRSDGRGRGATVPSRFYGTSERTCESAITEAVMHGTGPATGTAGGTVTP